MKTVSDRLMVFHIHDCHRQNYWGKKMEEAVLPEELKRQLPRSKIAPARCVNSLAEPGPSLGRQVPANRKVKVQVDHFTVGCTWARYVSS